MIRYITDKLIQSVITVLGVVIVVFVMIRLTGDPEEVYLPLDATPEMEEQYRQNLGLDQPIYVQFGIFLAKALEGDLGISYSTSRPVSESLSDRFPNTIRLALATALTALVLGILLGVVSAVLRKTLWNTFFLVFFAIGHSVPGFFALMAAVDIFGVTLGWLPIAGNEGFRSYIIPAATMGLLLATNIALVLRNSLIEVSSTEYMKYAALRGLKKKQIILKHGLRNAISPVIGMSSTILSRLLTGSLITETIMAWPGIGMLVYNSIIYRDFAMLQGAVLVMTFLVVLINFLSDVVYAAVDPRIRGEE